MRLTDKDISALITIGLWIALTWYKSKHLIASLIYGFVAFFLIFLYEKVTGLVKEYRAK